MASRSKTVAIIGSGVSGLGAAWLLDKEFDVTIYEAEPVLGGNAYTVDVPTSIGNVPMDMGVAFLRPWSYPNVHMLFGLLKVETFSGILDFGASFGPDDTWVTGRLLDSPLWKRIAPEASRFERQMLEVANLPEPQQLLPIRHYIRQGGYSHEFVSKGLFPMLSSLVVTRERLMEMPAQIVSALFQEYFSFFTPATWTFLRGGTRDFITRLSGGLKGRVRASTPVTSVTRARDGVIVRDARGGQAKYDQIILATTADVARRLLADPSADEIELLETFEYQPSTVYLHSDESILSPYLPRSTRLQYKYFGEDAGPALRGMLTYNTGGAVGLDGVWMSIYGENTEEPRPGAVLAMRQWGHLIVTPQSYAARTRLHQVQGVNRTWFCGAYTLFQSHEAALVSGMAVAEQLGAEYPFADRPLAARIYATLRGVMFPQPAREPPRVAAPRVSAPRRRPARMGRRVD